MIKDLTKDKPMKTILFLALPMMLSMAFQQLYNISDSVIAGKFVSGSALAAIGTSYPITVLFIAVATGLSIGCSVVISQLFGKKDYPKLKTSIFSSLFLILVISILLTIFGGIFCNNLLQMIHTPSDVYQDAYTYLSIYIYGIPFLFLYNAATSVYNGLGDAKTPFYFLVFSSLLNIALDILFVTTFQMGVAGVAVATFIAQGLASVLATISLIRRINQLEGKAKEIISLPLLKKVFLFSIPTIFQQSSVSIGNLLVQGLVNSFGSGTIGGYSAALKINTFVTMIVFTFASAMASFTAQNIGAGKIERVSDGFRKILVCEIIGGIILTGFVLLFKNQLLQLFVNLDDVIANEIVSSATTFLLITAPFYAVIGIKIITDGVLRGSGSLYLFMSITITDLIIRVVASYLLVPVIGFNGISIAFSLGWLVAAILAIIAYCAKGWKRKAMVQV